jgi:DNA topoisomerase I
MGAGSGEESADDVARAARLVYVSDTERGITRRRAGRGFSYRDPDGGVVRDPDTLARIERLTIPPAWRDVWICTRPTGHLQATGWDARGRKQYRYHPRWRAVRDAVKFERMADFGAALPLVRARVDADLRRPSLSRERVVAAVVRLLDETLVRVGNEEYARENGSYGLTTLREKHVDVSGDTIWLSFRTKGGKTAEQRVTDRRLARLVRRCQDLPGQTLFQYVDDQGVPRSLGSRDVNEYLGETMAGPFTAKDFRTWAASVRVAAALREHGEPPDGTRARKQIAEAVKDAAEALANTPAVCRASYVHPAVVEAHANGVLARLDRRRVRRELAAKPGLSEEEAALLVLLRHQQASAAEPAAGAG